MDKNQKEILFNGIWKIAEELRGTIDGWDFKNYVLGFLFYRYISENINNYVNRIQQDSGQQDFNYSTFNDSEIDSDGYNDLFDKKGFFIYPSQLFCNVLKNVDQYHENLTEHLSNIFNEINNSGTKYSGSTKNTKEEYERNFKGIFDQIDLDSPKLGSTVIQRNNRIKIILQRINEIDLGEFENNSTDIFGDAYEFIMGMYASNAGKSGGEYYTPYQVSKLLTKLGIANKTEIDSIYDPACGSGSLLLHIAKLIDNKELKYYGQDSNHTTYNLCRMNMFLHNINYSKFDIQWADTLIEPKHLNKNFDLIVSNPPYSVKWEGDDNKLLISDPRYAPAGVLAPKSKADYAFIMHSLFHLKETGKAAIVCFPGIFYRSGAEKKIRQYLVENNFIDAIISLPDNLFYGTPISTNILVLNKSKANSKILFINAIDLFVKNTNQKNITDEQIDEIVNTYKDYKEIEGFSKLISFEEIQNNDFVLSVSTYVPKNKKEEVININQINKELETVSSKINDLRKEINLIIKEIGDE